MKKGIKSILLLICLFLSNAIAAISLFENKSLDYFQNKVLQEKLPQAEFALKSKKYEQAISIYKHFAEENLPQAQYQLAYIYQHGLGVPVDNVLAAAWYLKAATGNMALAQFALGTFYFYGIGVQQDKEQAENLYQLAAKAHNPHALFMLSVLAPKEPLQMQYLQEAAAFGFAKAQYNIGRTLYLGLDGTKQDLAQAFAFFSLAAKQDLAPAQFMLGVMAFKGEMQAINKSEAVNWYQLAANQGFAYAQYNLGIALLTGEGISVNPSAAAAWFSKAKILPNAQYLLGYLNYYGIGVPKNTSKALEYYTNAANWNNAAAQYVLGYLYHNGLTVPKDNKRALDFYRQAAHNHYAEAAYMVGLFYQQGLGILPNLPKALFWYEKASLSGFSRAQLVLGMLLVSNMSFENTEKGYAFLSLATTSNDNEIRNEALKAIGILNKTMRPKEIDAAKALALEYETKINENKKIGLKNE